MSSYSSPTLKNLTLNHKAEKKRKQVNAKLTTKKKITGLSPVMNQMEELYFHTNVGVRHSAAHRMGIPVPSLPTALPSLSSFLGRKLMVHI